MRKIKISGIIIMLISITTSVLIFNTGCYDDDKNARVTINFQRNDLAVKDIKTDKHIIDRILEFFSTPAYAVIGWDSTPGELTLTVSGIETITYNIPSDATSYTITTTPAIGVTFEIISTTLGGNVPKNWGGHETVTIFPGDNVVSINMIPMTQIYSVNIASGLEVNFSTYAPTAWVDSYKIYRSDSADGPYSVIGTTASTIYSDTTVVMGHTYYYKISVIYNGKEGVLCDYVSALYNP